MLKNFNSSQIPMPIATKVKIVTATEITVLATAARIIRAIIRTTPLSTREVMPNGPDDSFA